MLHKLENPRGATNKKRKRLGRGTGSTFGKTCGKGHKGQNCRSGNKRRIGYEGGQMPIHRRLPKRGFKNIFRLKYTIVNIADIIKCRNLDITQTINLEAMVKARLVRSNKMSLKILGNGTLDIPLVVEAHKFSVQAEKKIIDAGGKPIHLTAEG